MYLRFQTENETKPFIIRVDKIYHECPDGTLTVLYRRPWWSQIYHKFYDWCGIKDNTGLDD